MNEFGDILSPDLLSNVDSYTIKVFDNDLLQRVEFYSKGKLKNISYSFNSDKDIEQILIENPNASFFRNIQLGRYISGESFSFEAGKLTSKMKTASDAITGNVICFHCYDIVKDEVIHTMTEKSYFDSTGTEIYLFTYDENGSCFHIIKVQEYQADFFASAIGKNPDVNFTWADFEYYRYSMPLVP